jgi:hypothetical protein
MSNAVQLGLDRVVDLRDGVTARDRGDTAKEIEILPPLAVVEELALAPAQLDRLVVEQPDAGEEALAVPPDEISPILALLDAAIARHC